MFESSQCAFLLQTCIHALHFFPLGHISKKDGWDTGKTLKDCYT